MVEQNQSPQSPLAVPVSSKVIVKFNDSSAALCVHASFFDITAPVAKKATSRDRQGMFESDSICPDGCQIMN
jgi:hypothetical protein